MENVQMFCCVRWMSRCHFQNFQTTHSLLEGFLCPILLRFTCRLRWPIPQPSSNGTPVSAALLSHVHAPQQPVQDRNFLSRTETFCETESSWATPQAWTAEYPSPELQLPCVKGTVWPEVAQRSAPPVNCFWSICSFVLRLSVPSYNPARCAPAPKPWNKKQSHGIPQLAGHCCFIFREKKPWKPAQICLLIWVLVICSKLSHHFFCDRFSVSFKVSPGWIIHCFWQKDRLVINGAANEWAILQLWSKQAKQLLSKETIHFTFLHNKSLITFNAFRIEGPAAKLFLTSLPVCFQFCSRLNGHGKSSGRYILAFTTLTSIRYQRKIVAMEAVLSVWHWSFVVTDTSVLTAKKTKIFFQIASCKCFELESWRAPRSSCKSGVKRRNVNQWPSLLFGNSRYNI